MPDVKRIVSMVIETYAAERTRLYALRAQGAPIANHEIERLESIWFKRFGSIIGWWETPHQR